MKIEIHEHTLSRALERGSDRLEIVDVLEKDRLITVTVYVFYGKGERDL